MIDWVDIPAWGELLNRLHSTLYSVYGEVEEILEGGPPFDDDELADLVDEVVALSDQIDRELVKVEPWRVLRREPDWW